MIEIKDLLFPDLVKDLREEERQREEDAGMAVLERIKALVQERKISRKRLMRTLDPHGSGMVRAPACAAPSPRSALCRFVVVVSRAQCSCGEGERSIARVFLFGRRGMRRSVGCVAIAHD